MADAEAEGENWDWLPPEVLGMIFHHLSVADLLSCSVVSKKWKTVARDVLKRNRECYAHINHIDIQDLNLMIASTDILEMINGLRIRNELSPKEERGSDSTFWPETSRCSYISKVLQSEEAGWKLDEAKQKICAVLSGQWRYLDLDMGLDWRHDLSLDQGLLLREVILATSDTLQKLIVRQDGDWDFVPCCAKSFPKLEVIQNERGQDLGCCFNKSLSHVAPKLKTITGAMMSLSVNYPNDRFTLERMKSIRVWSVARGEAQQVFSSLSGLHRLDLQCYRRRPYDARVEWNIVEWSALVFPFVLRSLKTLEELRIDTLELYNLSKASEGLKFPNLRWLSLATHSNVATTASEISALKTLNLPNLCPNLEQLELAERPFFIESEQALIPMDILDAQDQSNMPMAIDLRSLDGDHIHEQMILLSTIYPKISELRILKMMSPCDYDASKFFLPSFWKLPALEYLEISVRDPPRDRQFHIEAFLSGINVEEAQLLSPKYERKEDILNLCIVPIRPSLLHAKSLQELKITVETRWETVSHSWVTQVTENLPERHARNLKVTFDANKRLCNQLFRMRAFAWLRANEIQA